MNTDIMTGIFNVCLVTGFAIPIISLVMGAFGSVLGMDLDIDTDTDVDGLVPFNLMSLCFALIVFGVIGREYATYMTDMLSAVLLIALSVTISFVAYVMIYKHVIVKLKRNNPSAITSAEIVGSIGKLTLRVTHDSDGVVSVPDSTGAAISYRARVSEFYKLDETGRIDQGVEVVITEVDNDARIYYVQPLYK